MTGLLVAAALLCAGPAATRAAAPAGDPDLDGDGAVTLADLKHLAVDLSTLAAAWRGDVNGDGKVDTEDVRSLARLLIRRDAPEAEATEERVEGLIRHATAGDGGEDVRSILERLAGDAGPGAGSGGGRVRGARGRPVNISAGLSKYYGSLRSEPRKAAPPPRYQASAEKRARAFGAPLGAARAAEAFNRFVSAHADDVDLASGETPDPGVLGDAARRARATPLIVTGPAAERVTLLPRGASSLALNADDPKELKLRGTVKGETIPLAEEYERVSGLADGAAKIRDLVDPAFRDLPDPLAAQFLADLRDPAAYLVAADADHDRTIVLDEFLTHLFSPATARRVARGDADALGLKAGSPVVANYAAIVRAVVPDLAAKGLVDPGFAAAALDAVSGVAVAGLSPDAKDGTIAGNATRMTREGAPGTPGPAPSEAPTGTLRLAGAPGDQARREAEMAAAEPGGKGTITPTEKTLTAAERKLADLKATIASLPSQIATRKREVVSLTQDLKQATQAEESPSKAGKVAAAQKKLDTGQHWVTALEQRLADAKSEYNRIIEAEKLKKEQAKADYQEYIRKLNAEKAARATAAEADAGAR